MEMSNKTLSAISSKIAEALPSEHGYDKGFKDALESIALALSENISHVILDQAIQTALDAHANNYDKSDVIQLSLNVFDDVGNIVDGTVASVSVEQLSDIVDHASQLILIRRDGQSLENVLDELDEALSVADVINAV